MGKKGSWFSAIKRVFTHDKPSNGKKKNSKGIGETKSFIPVFREPSSIEKILGEADQLFIASSKAPPDLPTSARITTSKDPSPPGATSSKTTTSSPKVTQSRNEPTLRNQQHVLAIKIQAAYRGYMARRSFRALKGLVRLQGVVRGHNVKQQTMNAMKQMHLLVRLQMQIQSRRIQMLEHKNNNQLLSEAGINEDWDESLLTKEEVEERLQKKLEAAIKRERAMAYAYSHQLWKAHPKSAQGRNGYPWGWNCQPTTSHQTHNNVKFTPPRPVSKYKASPLLKNRNFTFDNQFHTPNTNRTPPSNNSTFINYSKPRRDVSTSSTYNVPLRDDDSLTSCPPFSVPNYMSPTVSAKAKVRTNSNLKERFMGTPSNDSKRRFSFPLTPNIASFKWNNKVKDTSSQKVLGKHRSSHSIGDMSVDSAVSVPTIVGRKPFNRFV